MQFWAWEYFYWSVRVTRWTALGTGEGVIGHAKSNIQIRTNLESTLLMGTSLLPTVDVISPLYSEQWHNVLYGAVKGPVWQEDFWKILKNIFKDFCSDDPWWCPPTMRFPSDHAFRHVRVLRAVWTHAVLVTRTVTDVRNGVRLVRTYRERGGNRGRDPSQCW